MDKVAIITGASSGIGEALARELHGRGYAVGLIARRGQLLQQICEALGGDRVAWAAADVTCPDSVEEAVAELQQVLGPCTLLVANAGIGGFTHAKAWNRETRDEVIKIMRVNYEGVVNSVGAVVGGMVERGSGHLAVVSSVAGYRGLPGFGAYSASKSAVTNFFEALRIEVAPFGVKATTIHPGYIETPLTAENKFSMPFLISAEESARLMANGLEKGKREVNLPWQMATVMGMTRWIPNWLWDRVITSMSPSG